MTRRPRWVVDTNVLISAFFWRGAPGRVIEFAAEGEVLLFTSRFLLDELRASLAKKKLVKPTAATGLSRGKASVGAHGSIAIVERFWKPLLAEDLEERVVSALLFYSAHRPHSSLRGATPLETFTRSTPACQGAVRPPLATARDAPTLADFRITHIDREKRLPVLARAA